MTSTIRGLVAADPPQEVKVEVEMKTSCVPLVRRVKSSRTDVSDGVKNLQRRHVQTSGCLWVRLPQELNDERSFELAQYPKV